MIRNPETGFVLRDRKYHLKTYKNCFIGISTLMKSSIDFICTGKESVTWILENCEYLGVKTREDAIKLGQQLMDMKVFQHVTKGSSFSTHLFIYLFRSFI